MITSSQAATPPTPLALCDYRFRDSTLLEAALTHPSSTDPSQADVRLRYQRLEFLGDAVWNLYVSDELFSLLPTASEGELTLGRVRLVSGAALAILAQRYGLGPLLLLSKGEESTGGRQKMRILANAFEAVIGAIYLDGGTAQIRDLARRVCLEAHEAEGFTHDPKTALQQLVQSLLHSPPRYRLVCRSGAPHAPTFEVEVLVGQTPIAKGQGRSRQEAERVAARDALRSFSHQISTTSSSDTSLNY